MKVTLEADLGISINDAIQNAVTICILSHTEAELIFNDWPIKISADTNVEQKVKEYLGRGR